MFDEMSFLIETNKKLQVGDTQIIEQRREYNKKTKDFEINNYEVTTSGVKDNYIKSDVNNPYRIESNKNPYLQLLDDFSGTNNNTTQDITVNDSSALKLTSTDFAYLRDLGVYPINRLMILRRYAEGVIVPKDLQLLGAEPISTVVGWVEDENEFLEFSFNEKWSSQGPEDMLHLMLNDMIQNSFGINMRQLVPIPGWGVGFVYGILNKMGLTDYNKTNLPIGDPNVLRESITREPTEMGLLSTFSFHLKTIYEQKYIGDIDMTVSTMDILQNLLTMGTSDISYIGKADSEAIMKLKAANNDPTNISAWVDLIGSVITGFISAIGSELKSFISGSETDTSGAKTQEKDASILSKKPKAPEQGAIIRKLFNSSILKTILASTVARYVWPLRGSIAMMTGEAATPWHLTIGNPYAPLFSMNNVVVEDVSVKLNGELAYNDIPKYMDVDINLKAGRGMGKNEIYDMFGINYKRTYTKVTK